MLEKIKKSFRSASSKNGSYSVGMIALVICMGCNDWFRCKVSRGNI